MKIFPFKAIYPNVEKFTSTNTFFESLREEYSDMREQGCFLSMEGEALYIYQIKGEYTHTGIVVYNDIDDYFEGKILGHELTLTEKEQTIIEVIAHRNAMIKPILLTYPTLEDLDSILENYISINKPILEIKFDLKNETHAIWVVKNQEVLQQISKIFEELIPKAYIADGHHRASILAQQIKDKEESGEINRHNIGLLCAYFPFSALNLYDFSREVQLSEMPEQLIKNLEAYFIIEPMDSYIKPNSKYELTLFLGRTCYMLKWKSEVVEAASSDGLNLDVELFNGYVLKEIFQINDIKIATSVKYINGTEPIEKLISKTQNNNVAIFNFYPLTIEDIVTVSDAGKTLPPKSTWFEPRMKSGLIIQEF